MAGLPHLCRSTVPTAFTGYSFHILEAVIVFANEVLVCFLFPIHIGLHRAYHLFTTVIHNGGSAMKGSSGYGYASTVMQTIICGSL